jgi:hypothetical protein
LLGPVGLKRLNLIKTQTDLGAGDQVRLGKILYPAVSNWSAWEIAEANTAARFRDWSPFNQIMPPKKESNCCLGLRGQHDNSSPSLPPSCV